MEFNEETRKLTSSTGYIKRKDGTLYADHPIYLGIFDNPSNYEEGNAEEYEEFTEEEIC